MNAVPGPETADTLSAAVFEHSAAALELPRLKSAARRDHGLHWPIIWSVVIAALLAWGMRAHLERYITPTRGLGYWLGITGGSMMLLLLVYSARKRARWLNWMGGIPAWFRIHMTLGVVGPVLVLFHTNFQLGSTNSNVALFCMLLVAVSGVVGRYIYSRMHASLYGKEDSLEELQAAAQRIREQRTDLVFLPDVLTAIDQAERSLINPATSRAGRWLNVFTAGGRAAIARWQLHQVIDEALARDALHAEAAHIERVRATVCTYADRRLDTARRVAEYRLYARLFSFWHILHIPLFFMLLIAAIAHVVAVNLY